MVKHRIRWLQAALNRVFNRPIGYVRQKLANNEAVLSLSILGIISGALAAMVILFFRWVIDVSQALIVPGGAAENFELLDPLWRFGLPATGGLLLGLMMIAVNRKSRGLGLAHVIHVTNNLHGDLPARNAILQFVAGSVAMITGQSGGREGPAVHLGAAVTSWAARFMNLPRNSSRILISCGTAAAIAASFNTPIAGVIFAMEVVMVEYTIAGFTPVILAAITATLLSLDSFGGDSMLLTTAVQMTSAQEVVFVAAIGVACGTIAASFVAIQNVCLRLSHINPVLRLSLAGIITGSVAVFVPEVLGLGYDTLQNMLENNIVGVALLAIVLGKLFVTAVSCGLGIPLGFIGPALIIGAGVGSLMGAVGIELRPDQASDITLYVLLGMGALMAAILNAPLAALLAIVELTNNAHVILPGMLAIICANLTHNGVFRQSSAQLATLLSQGFKIQNDPLSRALQRASVSSLMDRNFRRVSHAMSVEQVKTLLENRPRWLVVAPPDSAKFLVDSTDLVLHMEEHNARVEKRAEKIEEEQQMLAIHLLDIGGKRRQLADIQPQATLREALELMNQEDADALYVSGPPLALYVPPSGIITRGDIENYYRHPQRN